MLHVWVASYSVYYYHERVWMYVYVNRVFLKKDSSDNWRVAQTLKISFKYCEVIEEVNIYILMWKDVLLRKQIAE